MTVILSGRQFHFWRYEEKLEDREHQIKEVAEGIEMSAFTLYLIQESSAVSPASLLIVKQQPWISISNLLLNFILLSLHYPCVMFYHCQCLQSSTLLYPESLSFLYPEINNIKVCSPSKAHKEAIKHLWNFLIEVAVMHSVLPSSVEQ